MALCVNCGREIKIISRNCPYCNTPISMASVTNKKSIKSMKNDYDCKSNKLFLLSVFIPLFGLVISYIKREEEPLKSKSAFSGFLVGTLIYLGIIAFLLLINIIK